jgi:hypothetical protein
MVFLPLKFTLFLQENHYLLSKSYDNIYEAV